MFDYLSFWFAKLIVDLITYVAFPLVLVLFGYFIFIVYRMYAFIFSKRARKIKASILKHVTEAGDKGITVSALTQSCGLNYGHWVFDKVYSPFTAPDTDRNLFQYHYGRLIRYHKLSLHLSNHVTMVTINKSLQ